MNLSSHARAALTALFVTLLWSSSWVLIKRGMQGANALPALPFAGLRYVLAFVCVGVLLAFRRDDWERLRRMPRPVWMRLLLLGVVMYALTQGAQFLALAHLPAATVSLCLQMTSPLVALSGWFLLGERPTGRQWAGLVLAIVGVAVYFYPAQIPEREIAGLIAAVVGVVANAGAAVLGRGINRTGDLPPLVVTTVSMGFGAILLLSTGVAVQGIPHPTPTGWAIIGWLAVVNTTLAFTLWNHTLRTLSAMESSLINSTMLVQIAVLAYLFLGEPLTTRKIIGLALAGAGAIIVQWRTAKASKVS